MFLCGEFVARVAQGRGNHPTGRAWIVASLAGLNGLLQSRGRRVDVGDAVVMAIVSHLWQ
jgi:hypothetical protein